MFDEVCVTIPARPPAQGGTRSTTCGFGSFGARQRSWRSVWLRPAAIYLRRLFSLAAQPPVVSSPHDGADDRNRAVGAQSGGDVQLRRRRPRADAVHRAVPEAVRVVVGGETIADSTPHAAAVRIRTPAGLLLPARGRPLRRARAVRPAHALPEEGRGVLPHDPRRRQGRRGTAPGTTPSRSRVPSRSRT